VLKMSVSKRGANELRKGNYFIPDEEKEPYMVLGIEHSKSGKHGHAKNRIECIGLFNKKKMSVLVTEHDMIDVPEIVKKQGQFVDVDPENKIAHVMDLEDNNVYEVDYPMDEEEVDTLGKLQQLAENKDLLSEASCEYWDVMNKKFVTRVIINK
jgi:translation initiation factor 5A